MKDPNERSERNMTYYKPQDKMLCNCTHSTTIRDIKYPIKSHNCKDLDTLGSSHAIRHEQRTDIFSRQWLQIGKIVVMLIGCGA